jgi:hypothetical protein
MTPNYMALSKDLFMAGCLSNEALFATGGLRKAQVIYNDGKEFSNVTTTS